ncbi:MAG TPA: hypothetical protein VIV88_00590 [Gemmatimonadales bacterium]
MTSLRSIVAATYLASLPVVSHAQIEITLKNSFIENYKDRTTIEATYTVDKAHRTPNPPAKDGDMHIAGRAPQIGLATVAEIVNAASESAAVALVHSVEGTGDTVHITGAWRIWCEHAGIVAQVQGKKLAPFTTTNPPHVFEIHPITQVGANTVLDSWVPIDGYTPKEAGAAFLNYENRKSQITVNATRNTTTITTTMAGYNYVEFKMVLNGEQQEVADGRFVMAQVLDLQNELLVHNRRMVFVKGTAPEQKVQTLQAGDTLHVLGIPRIDLALVSYRVRNRATRPDALTWSLPYEILVVAVYSDTASPSR